MTLKNSVTLQGIDPVQLVAQRLNHHATSGPESLIGYL